MLAPIFDQGLQLLRSFFGESGSLCGGLLTMGALVAFRLGPLGWPSNILGGFGILFCLLQGLPPACRVECSGPVC